MVSLSDTASIVFDGITMEIKVQRINETHMGLFLMRGGPTLISEPS